MDSLTEKVDLKKQRVINIINRARMNGEAGKVIYHLMALTASVEELIGKDDFVVLVNEIFNVKEKENG